MLETGVKSDPAFCLGPSIEKTNSDLIVCPCIFRVPEATFRVKFRALEENHVSKKNALLLVSKAVAVRNER